ncbi:MAG: cation diffusion facilitator family transporter [Candidatus Omnitrophica bacterium]|nr:cation diffusion facilitator family transporter [Candidatus Omnitrophota bacterium]
MKAKCVKCGKFVPWVCFFGNSTLALFKLSVGFVSGSKGLIADGMHSASDVLATAMVLISLRIADRKDDHTHPWGHGKIEFAGAVMVYSVLLALSIFLFQDALRGIIEGTVKPPHLVSFVAAFVSIVANFILSGYGFCAGKQLNSPAMIANANENKADMLSSVAVVIGIVGANMGFIFLDALAAIVVALIIFKTALTLGLQALRNILDISLPSGKIELIKDIAVQYQGVKGVKFVRTRRVGQSVWIDMEIFIDAKKTVQEGYVIAREIRLALMRKFKHVKEVSVAFTCRENVVYKNRSKGPMEKALQPV